MDLKLAQTLNQPADSKTLLFVMDGLGGLPDLRHGRSELQSAELPNFDRLAAQSALGLTQPAGLGITPGSGPGHLALFGYDPLQYQIGRGVLEATGINFDLEPTDVAARGNLCTLDAAGQITDRRAGRIATEQATELVERLREIKLEPLDKIDVFVEPVREHRFVLVLRGQGLSENVSDTDPQRMGVPPLQSQPTTVKEDPAWGGATADLVNRFTAAAQKLLANAAPANGLLLRGFSHVPQLPSLRESWGIATASCAAYPMYRGLAKLAGMQPIPAGADLGEQIASLREHWESHDFFFLHYKGTDTAGEDGDFAAKVARLEEVDAQLPALLDLAPDVLMVAGDHSTPAVLAAHSWHPVPFLLHARYVRADATASFDEASCQRGALGTFPAQEALPLAMAHAGRLTKFGA